MRKRSFLPPPTCSRCNQRPVLGDSLLHTGSVWLCAACLTQDLPGSDVMTKMASKAIEADSNYALSKRAKVAGELAEAESLNREGQWHHQAAASIHEHGNRLARQSVIVHGEAIPANNGFMKETLSDPDLAAVESSEARGRLLKMNDAVALGVDVSATVKAANTAEKLIAHEIAVAHKVAMEQAMYAAHESNPELELKRLKMSARMMTVAQQGLLALQKLKTGGTQNVVVQHVHVGAGGQAVVGVHSGVHGKQSVSG